MTCKTNEDCPDGYGCKERKCEEIFMEGGGCDCRTVGVGNGAAGAAGGLLALFGLAASWIRRRRAQ
jgi:hypothetical protein